MSESADRKSKRGGGRAVAILVTVAILALLAAGGVWLWQLRSNAQTEDQSDSYDQPISRLELVGDNGNVEVTATDGSEVLVDREVNWTEDKPKSVETWSGETLRIKQTNCPSGWFLPDRCEINYRIQVPADVEVDLETDSGDVTTTGIAGEQTIKADSGDIRVDDSGADLDLEADSGNIDIDDAAGDIDLTVDSGNVTARELAGKKVTTTADSGNTELAFAVAPERVETNNDSGNVNLLLPDDKTAYKVTAATDSGSKDVKVKTDGGSKNILSSTCDSGNITIEYR